MLLCQPSWSARQGFFFFAAHRANASTACCPSRFHDETSQNVNAAYRNKLSKINSICYPEEHANEIFAPAHSQECANFKLTSCSVLLHEASASASASESASASASPSPSS